MSSLMATGHRDNQRQRLYNAESVSGVQYEISSAAGKRLLDAEARLIPQTGWKAGPVRRPGKSTTYAPSIEDCQKYVDDLVRAAWFQRRFGQRTYRIVWKSGGNATCRGGGIIALPPWARTEGVILHEVAHGIPHDGAWHGPEYAAILLALVRHRLGKASADRFRAAYREYKVRTKAAAVPKPVREVVSLVERRERAVRRQENADLQHGVSWRRANTARTIRSLAATPSAPFGAVGSKSRRAAMDTARTIHPAKTTVQPGSLKREYLIFAAEGVRSAIRRGEFGPVGSKPRTRAMGVARTLDKRAKGARVDGARVYAAKPEKW